MRELTVEKHLINRVKEHGGFVRKIKWLNHRGAPDRLVGFPATGEHYLVELKAPGKKLEPHQRREIKKLQKIGFEVWVLTAPILVENFLYQISKPKK